MTKQLSAFDHPQLIQSYVVSKYCVSTAYRKASIPFPVWYYETIVWEWDAETKEIGRIIETYDSGSRPHAAFEHHAEICIELGKNHSPEKRDV